MNGFWKKNPVGPLFQLEIHQIMEARFSLNATHSTFNILWNCVQSVEWFLLLYALDVGLYYMLRFWMCVCVLQTTWYFKGLMIKYLCSRTGNPTPEEEEARRISEMGKPILGEHSRLEVIIEESCEFKVCKWLIGDIKKTLYSDKWIFQ